MKNYIRLAILTVGNETVASSRTRVYQYLPYLQSFNIITKIIVFDTRYKKIRKIYLAFEFIRFLFIATRCDIIFLQKVLLGTHLLSILRSLRKPIIYDFDDAIYSVHQKDNEAYQIHCQRPETLRLQHALSISRLVIIENEFTEEFAKKYCRNILRILGPIDTNRYFPAPNLSKDIVTIGWIGSPPNTCYLDAIRKPLEKILLQYKYVHCLLIGAAKWELAGCEVKVQPWSLSTEVQLLQELDIGLMPLPDDDWSRGKGGYKLLQYGALGIPSIASPVGVNKEIIISGETGFLAKTDDEWYRQLEILITTPKLRKTMGQKARTSICERYSFEHYAPVLIHNINKLLQ